MTGVLDALLPWLAGQQVMQWAALVLMVGTVLAGWLATLTAIVMELDLILGVLASTLSVTLGIGGLALGRYFTIQLGTAAAARGPNMASGDQEGFALAGVVLYAAMLAVGILLVMGIGASLAADEVVLAEPETVVFRVLTGFGLALWVAHEITLVFLITHHGWPLST